MKVSVIPLSGTYVIKKTIPKLAMKKTLSLTNYLLWRGKIIFCFKPIKCYSITVWYRELYIVVPTTEKEV